MNIRSLVLKLDDVTDLASVTDSEIIVVTEAWLTPQISDSELSNFMPDFDIYRYVRSLSRGGGVLIGTKRLLSCTQISILTPLEILWLQCVETYSAFIIGIYYRPPNSGSSFMFHFNEALSTISGQYPKAKIRNVGYFYYPGIDWNNLTSLRISNECAGFIDTWLKFNLSQLVLESIRIMSHMYNVIVLILITVPE